MHSAAGILTSTGGMHQPRGGRRVRLGQVLRRRRGRDADRRRQGHVHRRGKTFGRDDVISIDGSTGEVMARARSARVEPKLSGDFARS
jgi:pyruvate,orthophosphate dikinase